jgi:uncharacterized protein YecE (DUF72 family)
MTRPSQNASKTSSLARARIGTAAWTLPKDFAAYFSTEGTHLERYARALSAVEINSSFYREHKPATYKKWAASVPSDFRFSVKLSKKFTHIDKLNCDREAVNLVLSGIEELGPKWGALLVQLPPSLAFEAKTAERFFSILRERFGGLIAFEPRHRSWVSPEALALQIDFALTKVFADPEPCPLPTDSKSKTLVEKLVRGRPAYLRLHGSPEIYKSNYEPARLREFHSQIGHVRDAGAEAWCIFDNTTFGFATANALTLEQMCGPKTLQESPFVLSSFDA